MDDGDLEIHPTDDLHNDDPVSSKLDRVLDKLEKIDLCRDETDRRFESLVPNLSRETEPPLGLDEEGDGEFENFRRRRTVDRGFRTGNPTSGIRDGPYDDRGRRDDRVRNGLGWEHAGYCQPRQQFAGYARQFNRQASCWDPSQRYQSSVSGDKPPRFDGSDATNWVSRVQYYFDHVMMPDAQRLHYAVMLFDPLASEWVFNYCANNDFVTWQVFLEDVRHRFYRQSFKDYFGLIAKLTQTGSVLDYHDTFEKYLNRVQGVPEVKLFTHFVAGLKPDMQERLRLHRPSSLAEAMALALELADSQGDRQQHQLNSLRPWQNQDSRNQPGPTSSQPATQLIPGQQPVQGRTTEQSRPTMVRVSQAEKAERVRRGLYYYCPEKWVVGHVCKQRLLCYADEEDELGEGDFEKYTADEPGEAEVAHIHTMNGG